MFKLHFMNGWDLGKLVRGLEIVLHDRTGVKSQKAKVGGNKDVMILLKYLRIAILGEGLYLK